MKRVAPGLVALALLMSASSYAGINFGSRQSALEVSGGTLDFDANATLSKGTLRTVGSGSITNDSSEYLDCSSVRIQTKYDVTTKGMHVDGKVYVDDDTMTLEDNDRLLVNGGQVTQNVTVNGADASPSIIQGHGSFYATITVSDEKELIMRWQGPLNQSVTLTPTTGSTSSQLTLEANLAFANGSGLVSAGGSGTAQVNFAGYKASLGGFTDFGGAQTWDKAQLALTGDTTINQNITLTTSAALIECNGHKLTVSGGFLGSVGGTVNNGTIAAFDSGVFGGTGSWNLRNVILSDADESIRVIDGQLTGGTADVFEGAATWSDASHIELLKDFTLVDEWQFDAASSIEGNGYTFNFTDTTGTIDYDDTLTLSNITLNNLSSGSFSNVGSQKLRLRNVRWYDGAQAGALAIGPSPLVDSAQYAEVTLAGSEFVGNIFGGAVTWGQGAHISLLSNCTFSVGCNWTFNGKAGVIDGNGMTLNMVNGSIYTGADLYLNDIVLADVDALAFSNAADNDLYLTNVTWVDDTTEGIVRITGNTEDTTASAAQVELATSNSGNLFATAVNWKNGVNLELLKGITFSTGAAWTFTKSSVINGNGNIINLNSVSGTDPITVASGETLTISNAVIVGWGASDISFAGGTLKLVNTTIILDDNVTLASNEPLIIDGSFRMVTDNYKFDGSAAGANNYVNGVTAWFDTLGHLPQGQLRLGSFSGGGRVAMSPLADWADITFSAYSNHLVYPLRLHYDCNTGGDAVFESLGRKILADNTDSGFSLLGDGRALYFGRAPISGDTAATSDKLLTVSGSDSNVVELHDLVLVGWSENHISDTDSMLRYCTGTVIKLQDNESLTTNINISVAANSGETVIIDLNGHDLDMSDSSAAFTLPANDTTVTVRNGRIINIQDNGGAPKFICGDNTSTWIFQDVDLVLAGNTTFSGNNIEFKGDCSITGTGLTDDATNPTTFLATFSDMDMTIAAGAKLKVDQGVALVLDEFNTNTATTLTFGSTNATLHLLGSTLKVSGMTNAPTFTHGTIRIDDVVTFIGDMALGGANKSELELDLMPAASIEISSGTVTYNNTA